MPLSQRQQTFLDNCDHRWNLKVGAVRSGKSWLDFAVVIPKRIIALKGEGAVLLMGNTQGTLLRNIIEPMREIYGEELVSNLHGDNTVTIFGKRCYALGADNKKHVARIQGMTVEYGYGDEMTTWNPDVFQMLKSRLSCAHSHFDGTMNPAEPTNFMKDFIDSDTDIFLQTYTLEDNPFLPADYVTNLKKEYAGTIFYNRYILGQWVFAQGIIYKMFADEFQKPDNRFYMKELPKDTTLRKITIGVDFGGNESQHAFVATAITTKGVVIILASERVDPRGTDADFLAKAFADFAFTVFHTWGEISYVFCDNAEQVLIESIRKRLRRTQGLGWLGDRVFDALKSEVNDRIRLTAILMGGGRLFYLPTARTVAEALASAIWSDLHKEKDIRLDDGSTDIDSLDAFEYSIEGDTEVLLQWSSLNS